MIKGVSCILLVMVLTGCKTVETTIVSEGHFNLEGRKYHPTSMLGEDITDKCVMRKMVVINKPTTVDAEKESKIYMLFFDLLIDTLSCEGIYAYDYFIETSNSKPHVTSGNQNVRECNIALIKSDTLYFLKADSAYNITLFNRLELPKNKFSKTYINNITTNTIYIR